MIAARVVASRTKRNDPHAPVGLMLRNRQLRNHRVGFVWIQQAEPHRNSCQHAGLDHFLVVLVQSKRVGPGLSRPECLVHELLLLRKFLGELLADVVFAREMSEVGQRRYGLGAKYTLIKLSLHRKQRTALNPTVAEAKVLRQT